MKKEKWREDKKCKAFSPTHAYLSIAVQYSTVQYSTCCSNRFLWSMGSVNSENAFACSLPTMYISNRSTIPVFDLCGLARGDT